MYFEDMLVPFSVSYVQSKLIRCVRDTCLRAGLRCFNTILMTASLSSQTINFVVIGVVSLVVPVIVVVPLVVSLESLGSLDVLEVDLVSEIPEEVPEEVPIRDEPPLGRDPPLDKSNDEPNDESDKTPSN